MWAFYVLGGLFIVFIIITIRIIKELYSEIEYLQAENERIVKATKVLLDQIRRKNNIDK